MQGQNTRERGSGLRAGGVKRAKRRENVDTGGGGGEGDSKASSNPEDRRRWWGRKVSRSEARGERGEKGIVEETMRRPPSRRGF